MNARTHSTDKVIREALKQIFSLQLRLGVPAEKVSANVQTCLRMASHELFDRIQGVGRNDVYQFGTLLRSWHRNSKYLTGDGFPRHLSTAGTKGLQALIRAHYPKSQVSIVFRALKKAGLIRQDSRGKWYPTRRHAVFPTLSTELLAHFSEIIGRFVETMTRNVTTRNAEEILFERASKVTKLPVADAADFREFVNRQALAFLEAVDDWLESRVVRGKFQSGRKCTAGVVSFAFMDDIKLTKKLRAASKP